METVLGFGLAGGLGCRRAALWLDGGTETALGESIWRGSTAPGGLDDERLHALVGWW